MPQPWEDQAPTYQDLPKSYKLTRLIPAPGLEASSRNLNNQGQVVGSSFLIPFRHSTLPYAFLWQDGQFADMGSALKNNVSEAFHINDKGQVVGYFAANGTHAFLWQDGQLTDINPFNSSYSIATSINNRGQVVGFACEGPNLYPPSCEEHIFLWENGQATDLGVLHGPVLFPSISNKGEIVGSSTDINNLSRPFLWRNGQISDLGTFMGDPEGAALDINDKGQIVGWSKSSTGSHAVLWQKGQIIDLGVLDSSVPPCQSITTYPCGSLANAINNHGQVVGSSPVGILHRPTAFIWQNGQITDLNSLISPAPGVTLLNAVGINNRGQIVVEDDYNTYLLTPLPEHPSSSSLQISSSSWYLGTYPVGQTSDTGTIYAYADGPDPVRFAHTGVEGVSEKDFFITANTCGSTLAPYTTCAISFAYTPSVARWRSAFLALHDNSAGGPYAIPLYGLGY